MIVIQGVVVTVLLLGAHYMCHRGAEGERVSVGSQTPLTGSEMAISSDAERKKYLKREEKTTWGAV